MASDSEGGSSHCSGTTSVKAASTGPRCSVCGDEASGFHYGVDSCEGCKGFFRRCIIQGLTQQCANSEKCEITPLTRNSCQYCRLKKCFSVGMSRGASRLGRRPKRLKNTSDCKSSVVIKPPVHIAPHPVTPSGVLPLSMDELEALLDKLNSQNRYNIKLPSLLAALGRLIQDGEHAGRDELNCTVLSALDGNSEIDTSAVTKRLSPDTTGVEADINLPDTSNLKKEPDLELNGCGSASSRITNSYDARALVGTVYHQLREAEQRRRLLGPLPSASAAAIDTRAACGPSAATDGDLPQPSAALNELAEEARHLPEPGSERAHLVDQVIRSVVEAHCSTCNYTSDKVAAGLQRYREVQSMSPVAQLNANLDPMRVWTLFVANMAPVIRRVVSFSKFLPGFSELVQDDQIKLIKQGSFEVILARYVLLFTDDGMFVPDMSVKVPRHIIRKMPMGDFFEEQWKFASILNRLCLTDGELGLLTAVMILNPDRSGLSNHKAIHKLRGLMLQCLYVHMKTNHPDMYDKLFMDLVSVLPLSDHINQMHSRNLNSLKLNSPDIKFPELHLEVYDGQP